MTNIIQIKLPHGEWEYDSDELLGGGGFGDVFAGTASGYGSLAIKKIHSKLVIGDDAHRELRIAEELVGSQFTHVMPILDSGLDVNSGRYFIVMPQAERSLQDDLDTGLIFEDEAAAILLQIANGLSEIADLVHRDLKPDNVLFHNGVWKVADFGIARFVEEATSRRTLKEWMTDDYAAPEQWRFEHATPATDIYALGCIGYALLTGQPPFSGPARADFRLQHLQETPPSLQAGDPELRSLLHIMLSKFKESRPNLARVQRRLSEITEKSCEPSTTSAESSIEALAEIGVTLVEEEAQAEAKQIQEKMRYEGRKELANEAWEILGGILDTLYEKVKRAVPTAIHQGPAYLRLGNKAALMTSQIGRGGPYAPDAFPQSGWDVIAGALIAVHQDPPDPSYARSASLWYTDLGSRDGTYRWYEVSYYALPKTDSHVANVPYALQDFGDADAAAAESGVHRIATSPRPIDAEDANDFYARWIGFLATAGNGELKYPSRLPID